MQIVKLEGFIAAPFTPMNDEGELNIDLVPEYYSLLEKNGVAGAFINGSTGEGVSLTQKEKQAQAAAWAECMKNDGKFRIINLVGGTSYRECIENAVFSQQLGLSAIAVLAPYYFKPCDAEELARFVAKVGEAVPEMPVYFYHIPALTGVNIPMIDFLRIISKMLPNFTGIKYTQEDFMDFLSCLNFDDRKYDMLWGSDECLLSALVLGCHGAVGSTYNYAAPLYHAMIRAFDNGNLNEAGRLQQKSIDMISLLGKYGGIATGKAYMKLIGIDCGEFRSPVENMTKSDFPEFRKDVKDLKMDNYFSVR